MNGKKTAKFLTRLGPKWPLPTPQTACWRESVERHWPRREQRWQQMEWHVSRSPLGKLLLSGLPHTEDLMAAPRWWEGCNVTSPRKLGPACETGTKLWFVMDTTWDETLCCQLGLSGIWILSLKSHLKGVMLDIHIDCCGLSRTVVKISTAKISASS